MNSSLKEINSSQNLSNKTILRQDELLCFNFIINQNDAQNLQKINIEIKYSDNDKKIFNQKYNITPEEIPKGDELSKLIMYNIIKSNTNLDETEKLILSLKCKILTKYTSLFTDIELSDKISNEMKLQILNGPSNPPSYQLYGDKEEYLIHDYKKEHITDDDKKEYITYDNKKELISDHLLKTISLRNKNLSHYNDDEDDDDDQDDLDEPKKEDNKNVKEKEKEKKKLEEKPCDNNKDNIKPNHKINLLSNKKDIMKMINTQDFIKGYWEENDYTKIIKEKYISQYNSLKNLKNININKRVSISILIILFISNENKELLNELYLVIKKARIFIKKETNKNYEDKKKYK